MIVNDSDLGEIRSPEYLVIAAGSEGGGVVAEVDTLHDVCQCLTILAGGNGAVLALRRELREGEEHHRPGVADAGQRGLSKLLMVLRSLEVT